MEVRWRVLIQMSDFFGIDGWGNCMAWAYDSGLDLGFSLLFASID